MSIKYLAILKLTVNNFTEKHNYITSMFKSFKHKANFSMVNGLFMLFGGLLKVFIIIID